MTTNRLLRIACATLLCVAYAHWPAATYAQDPARAAYPAKLVQLVFPYPPGGGGDLVARLLGKKLNEAWQQPVIVDNRAGASGMIGATYVAKAAPDGYTLLVGYTSEIATNGSLYSKMAYDPIKDFAPVGLLVSMPMALVVHPSLPVTTVADLVKLAQRKPNELSYASFGVGSAPHFAAESLARAAKIQMVHVPYKGAGPAMIDIISGQVCCGFVGLTAATPYLQSGKLRALAVSTARRSPTATLIPTVAESGYPDFDFPTWLGLFAPAGTPPDMVARLNADSIKALHTADAKSVLQGIGAEPGTLTPDQMGAFVRKEIAKYGKLARDYGVKAE